MKKKRKIFFFKHVTVSQTWALSVRPCIQIVHPIFFSLFIIIECSLLQWADALHSQLTATLGHGVPLTQTSFNVTLRLNDFPLRLCRRVTQQLHVAGFQIVCNCQFIETDKSGPTTNGALVLFPFPLTLALRIVLTMCGVSMLQIFEPFSPCCSAYTGKLNKQQEDCASWQYYTLSEQKITFS